MKRYLFLLLLLIPSAQAETRLWTNVTEDGLPVKHWDSSKWGLVIGVTAGKGTLWDGGGHDFKSLDECKQAWQRHMDENPTWPREQWRAYCASARQRVDIYP
jgi:hypothetical protein